MTTNSMDNENPIRSLLKAVFPAVVWDQIRKMRHGLKSTEERFTNIYRKRKKARGMDMVSGAGSSLERAANVIEALPGLLREIDAKTLLDAPCGNFNWMKEVDFSFEKYIGIDIVDELIRLNEEKFSDGSHEFLKRDVIKDILPRADIILSRDCLVWLAFDDGIKVIKNFKRSGAQHLLTTTMTTLKKNENKATGYWRALNLEIPPFNFPKPLKIIPEKSGVFNRCLGLWKLADINL